MAAAKPTGRFAIVSLTGALIPYRDGRPVLMCVTGEPGRGIPCFTELEQLEAWMAAVEEPWDEVKEVADEAVFLDVLPQHFEGEPLVVMVNPYRTEHGTTRYLEVRPRGPDGATREAEP